MKLNHNQILIPHYCFKDFGELVDLPDGAEVNWHLFKAWQRVIFRAGLEEEQRYLDNLSSRSPYPFTGADWKFPSLSEYLKQYESIERAKRVRAFGRKRLLLKVLWPLVKLTARMEGRA